ncbi:hypothetical protein Nepgr_005349 [Nepenthes gracilis]|uniref:Uncharacterized protein n=1 Tax=Nepenthes gracilis TaxID=150966 RepID=A0AAD3XGB0_NEPGR|nr:hypothetical protein Nepgr_005349 [Nepenthes gracilis]
MFGPILQGFRHPPICAAKVSESDAGTTEHVCGHRQEIHFGGSSQHHEHAAFAPSPLGLDVDGASMVSHVEMNHQSPNRNMSNVPSPGAKLGLSVERGDDLKGLSWSSVVTKNTFGVLCRFWLLGAFLVVLNPLGAAFIGGLCFFWVPFPPMEVEFCSLRDIALFLDFGFFGSGVQICKVISNVFARADFGKALESWNLCSRSLGLELLEICWVGLSTLW